MTIISLNMKGYETISTIIMFEFKKGGCTEAEGLLAVVCGSRALPHCAYFI
jgi:hypothetical protein